MMIRKLKLCAIAAALLFTAGCATTSHQQQTPKPSQHWTACAVKGGMVMGVPAVAYSLATGGAAFVVGAIVSGTGCALAPESNRDFLSAPTSMNTLHFSFASVAIKSMDEQKLNELLKQLDEDSRILITGHACDIGTKEYNQSLSEHRANTVKNWLVDRGIPAAHIETVGKGEDEPVQGNETEAMREKNRRVVINLSK